MKIAIESVKLIPKEVSKYFGVCIYGELDDSIKEWINFHNLKHEQVGSYTNIHIDQNLEELFINNSKSFEFVDGFSPNLNKHLHLGHASNLVLAKAFVSMGVAKKTIAILGDTFTGEVTKEEALQKYQENCAKYHYSVDQLYIASQMLCQDESIMVPGAGKYENTKVFIVGEEKIVGVKADGSTSYFYQDVALAQKLNAPTLYLTGKEQCNHFALLKKLFPQTHHLGLGLVKVKGGKMSSRDGNVIMFDEVMHMLKTDFGFESDGLAYNVLSGLILKSQPSVDKNVDLDTLKNPLNSAGLYLSYTLAKMKSAGVHVEEKQNFSDLTLQFKEMKSKRALTPNVLFEGLTDHAHKMSVLYETHTIKGNEENKKMFASMASDLLLGMQKIGMFNIDKV